MNYLKINNFRLREVHSPTSKGVKVTLKKLLTGLTFLFLLSLSGLVGGLLWQFSKSDFKSLGAEQRYQQIITERDYAISKAVEAGNYRCCITPPCTMCYLEANQWNNFTASTCACDDLIAEGKKPCPQCLRSLCETSGKGTCKLNGDSK